MGGREGLQPIEKTVIDRCVRLVYREMAPGLETAETPLLQDLYEELLKSRSRRPAVWQWRWSSTAPALLHYPLNSGEGLLFYGNVTIPFVDRFHKGEIYNLLTTRPEDMDYERKDE